jgi:two-component system sensor histidine kinase KdpD
VEEVIRQGILACVTHLGSRQVSIIAEPRLPRILADPPWLQKVICNLVENAAKYSLAGTPISVRAVADGERIAINITDQGMGIPESEQVLIFEKFYRGRAQTHRLPGTGMGLAISRAIVEAHHGTISVSSVPGEGSTFTVRIPTWRGGSRIG